MFYVVVRVEGDGRYGVGQSIAVRCFGRINEGIPLIFDERGFGALAIS